MAHDSEKVDKEAHAFCIQPPIQGLVEDTTVSALRSWRFLLTNVWSGGLWASTMLVSSYLFSPNTSAIWVSVGGSAPALPSGCGTLIPVVRAGHVPTAVCVWLYMPPQ